MNGDAFLDMFGYSTSLNSNGTVVVASSGSGTGYVRIFAYNSGTSIWEQQGNTINGEASGDFAGGSSVSISSDGTTIVIGAEENDGTGNNAGHMRIFKYSGTAWTQMGSDMMVKLPQINLVVRLI